ncbi:MAG: HAMP domain-containing protein [Sediminimonas qiaohouensis]|uniref:histidine kinase n=1 Tax=Sediminimonas qiaohouensis TaxID=552061 RepID=A0A7C9L6Z9_9RHOB|nr:sensor histidine kinase [Sediminimonas qiaohouensis]MTJ03815.1 HAMP domain-containing protein [Sediminimonas qiaohouensis]
MAFAERMTLNDQTPRRDGDVVLGDDFIAPANSHERDPHEQKQYRGRFSFRHSPLTRKIIIFNLVALNVLVAGVLFLNSSRESLAVQRGNALVGQVELVADVFEAQLPVGAPVSLATGDGLDVAGTVQGLDLREGLEVFVYDTSRTLVDSGVGTKPDKSGRNGERTIIVDLLTYLWAGVEYVLPDTPDESQPPSIEEQVADLLPAALSGETAIETARDEEGGTVFAVASPIMHGGDAVGVVALISAAGEIDQVVRSERERILQMFLVAALVSIGLSIVLASTIATPISDLATAAEQGRRHNRSGSHARRIRIPDLSARPDEIGRLSGALRGMVTALYDRIDSNEQFAADVAHEIKNPLASLRSAVGTMRVAKRPDQIEKMLDVIEHDVRRLDRLVSDISNASRLDSELVKEEQEAFDLLKMLDNLGAYLSQEAHGKGIDFITDLPDGEIRIHGLEARLAQVFVNLITNAISFCEEGDAIRIWARRRDDRVLIVVEDTGPGIPEQALTKVFKRFYSERPEGQFGNNSGLGLAISKQIVEAHGGVIWAENIRPTDADITSDPLGARFVVGLPV